jgi:multiple sugar transport system ATP-binding protein
MSKLTIKKLSKSFGTVKCLDRVSLEVDDGQLAVIIGPSGCGKTTLMRCITGLETFSEGSIFIDDELINDKEPKDRDVAMVFQYYALYPHMTVRHNLSLGLEHTTDLSKDEIRMRVQEIAHILKISKLLERKPSQLSGGESQRVAIGRALVRKPKIFLLDEPLSAVDAKLRRELRTEIKKIQRRFGVTTIYVTHDQEEAMAIGDRLVVLRDGKIHQAGTPEEVFNNPKDQFVASFIGKPPMNFIESLVISRDNKYYLENREFFYEISKSYFERYLSSFLGKTIIAGIRPSSINIIMQNSSSDAAKTSIATVSLVENMGNENHIYLNVGSIKIIIKSDAEIVPKIGDKLKISFEEEDLHLFDMDSKESLKIYHN